MKFPAIAPVLTREEIHIAKMTLAVAIGRSNHPRELRDRARQTADRLKAMIISTAKQQQTEQFRRHIAEYVQPTWENRCGRPEFLPPIVGSEYDDWEVPDLYHRRLAVRYCPTVIEIIGAPDPAWGGEPDYVTRWDLVLGEVLKLAGIQLRAKAH